MNVDKKQYLLRLDERMDALGERIATIEGKLEKENVKEISLKKYLSEYGGIFALILSIVLGIFTIFDNIVLKPQKEEANNLIELEEQSHCCTNTNSKSCTAESCID